MRTLLIVVISYLLLGAAVLLIFEKKTQRVSKNLDKAGVEAQETLVQMGSYLKTSHAKAAIMIVTWLFWPFVIIGYLDGGKDKKGNGTKKT